ncbi:GNAT family N-acetyltransferase [Haliangium sp. UPWRP_2]|uniref:GNAT family N-acetyltransferase n=1 Tax=Haliangium sp. UPWRP_2 TaxID=1931276 RepID=UPI001E3D48F9|nr:GNAT family N-acetyltransferase [Haliangium sp. UPWRP_2]
MGSQMNAINAELARTGEDLRAILDLQRANLEAALSPDDARAQGFVTVAHTLEILEQMHALAPSVIARAADGTLAGYALTMLPACRGLLPVLAPMFALLDALAIDGRRLGDSRFYVMGQICVARPFRGHGVVEALYREHAARYRDRFDWIVTEVATRNARSLRAHERIGFREIARNRDAADEWSIIAWDFR